MKCRQFEYASRFATYSQIKACNNVHFNDILFSHVHTDVKPNLGIYCLHSLQGQFCGIQVRMHFLNCARLSHDLNLFGSIVSQTKGPKTRIEFSPL